MAKVETKKAKEAEENEEAESSETDLEDADLLEMRRKALESLMRKREEEQMLVSSKLAFALSPSLFFSLSVCLPLSFLSTKFITNYLPFSPRTPLYLSFSRYLSPALSLSSIYIFLSCYLSPPSLFLSLFSLFLSNFVIQENERREKRRQREAERAAEVEEDGGSGGGRKIIIPLNQGDTTDSSDSSDSDSDVSIFKSTFIFWPLWLNFPKSPVPSKSSNSSVLRDASIYLIDILIVLIGLIGLTGLTGLI